MLPPDYSLSDAIKKGDIEAVKQHLDAGADVNAKTKNGYPPLHEAAGWGHKEVVELLIAEGADVNAKDNYGQTTLLWAALKGHKEIVELLIANDVDVNTKNVDSKTPLDLANGETADLLRKHGGKTGAELKAAGK